MKQDLSLVVSRLSRPVVQAHKLTKPILPLTPRGLISVYLSHPTRNMTYCMFSRLLHSLDKRLPKSSCSHMRLLQKKAQSLADRSPSQLNPRGSSTSCPLYKHDIYQEKLVKFQAFLSTSVNPDGVVTTNAWLNSSVADSGLLLRNIKYSAHINQMIHNIKDHISVSPSFQTTYYVDVVSGLVWP